MIAKIEMRKCCNCGHEFIRTIGGFIMKIEPSQCPHCGSDKSKKFSS